MTVVVAVKVYDGIVIATDSASTMPVTAPGSTTPTDNQVWNNADKVFHLHRDLPIGLATWGRGQIQSSSIATLAKDLRKRFMGRDPGHPDWALDVNAYKLSEVADRVVMFMFDELLSSSPSVPNPVLGFFLTGISAESSELEAFEIIILDEKTRPTPVRVWDQDQAGWRVYGQGDAVARLFNGYSPALQGNLLALVPPTEHAQLTTILSGESRPGTSPAMPFADAINFAKFCADVTVGYSQYSFGANTVGGSIDLAAISRHEGFKWVQRKHYYPVELNPRRPHEHDH
jgi:hypothetical protein